MTEEEVPDIRKKTATNNEEGKNDYLAPNISKLDTKTNAFLIMGKNWDENAMNVIATEQLQAAQKLWAQDLADYIRGASEEEQKRLTEEFTSQYPRPTEKLSTEDIYAQTKRTLYVKIEESGGTIKTEAKYVLNTYDYVKKGGNK